MPIDESVALAATQELVAAHVDMHVRRMTTLPYAMARRFDQLVEEPMLEPSPLAGEGRVRGWLTDRLSEQNKIARAPPVRGAMQP